MAGKYMSKVIDGREVNVDVNQTNGMVYIHLDAIANFVPEGFDLDTLEINRNGDYSIPLEQFLELSESAGWEVE